jgi:hypothetical protein
MGHNNVDKGLGIMVIPSTWKAEVRWNYGSRPAWARS